MQKTTYSISEDNFEALDGLVNESNIPEIKSFLKQSFTPGSLLFFVQKNKISLKVSLEEFLDKIIELSKENNNAEFGEGYWSDHWTYNLDLIQSYIAVYPDKEKELLFDDDTYTYFESKAIVKPRNERYVQTSNGVRQYNFLDTKTKENVTHKYVKTKYGKGEVFTTNLIMKILLLDIVKFATLDSYGMGVEMEGGKPGWYDALNGLPGFFGSSMCETYELQRMIEFTIEKLTKYNVSLDMPKELHKLMIKVNDVIVNNFDCDKERKDNFICWSKMNDAKEEYRKITIFGVDGGCVKKNSSDVLSILKNFRSYINAGIKKALEYSCNIAPAYFAYELVDYTQKDDSIIAKGFEKIVMPHFLEGPVRFLKLNEPQKIKKQTYIDVKNSNLYDKKLNMYKVNESLEKASFEIGRSKAFTPGWLENESIWLHMEYKYLLETLKAGLYKEFFTDFKNQCIPFLDADVYGRSLLENSSFIVSSANPNEKIHGKGFVARLSGSTAEFIQIWQIMMFGNTPFTQEDNALQLSFMPAIPKYLIGEDKSIICTFLGAIKVKYIIDSETDLIPDNYKITQMSLKYKDDKIKKITGDKITGTDANDVRDGKVDMIEVDIKTLS